MAGAFILAIVACGIAQVIWSIGANKIQEPITRLYSLIFGSLIRKGWFQP